MKIHIETEPFAIDYWYDGSITIDVGDKLEYKEENYEFSIHETDSGYKKITWVEDIPANNEEIELQILKQFENE